MADITGVEIDFVVPDSHEALELYERVFGVERIEVTPFAKGKNEVIFQRDGPGHRGGPPCRA